MRAPVKASNIVDNLYQVLDLVLARCNLNSLVIVSVCSKHCNDVCRLYSQQNIHLLLPALLRHLVATEANSIVTRRANAVRWLCKMAGAECVTAQANLLVSVPMVPGIVAKMLVEGGVLIQYQQLIDAARNRIPGIEVWIQPGLTHLPAVVRAAQPSTGDKVKFRQLMLSTKPSELAELLHITVNAQSEYAAAALLKWVLNAAAHQQYLQGQYHPMAVHSWPSRDKVSPEQCASDDPQLRQQLRQQLTTPLVKELLLTAAVRGHHQITTLLLTLPATQAISAEEAAAVLQHAIGSTNGVVSTICSKLEPVKNVPSSKICSLMHRALQQQDDNSFKHLSALPAAASMSAAEILVMLQQAVQQHDVFLTKHLCQLPASAGISSDSFTGLLETAIKIKNEEGLGKLMQAPAFSTLGPWQAYRLMVALRLAGSRGACRLLLQSSLVNQLDVNSLLQLCSDALKAGNHSFIDLMLDTPAAYQLPPAAVAELLGVAIECGGSTGDYNLSDSVFALPAAANISTAIVHQLMCFTLAAFSAGEATTEFQRLCQLPAAQQLGPDAIGYSIRQALQVGKVQEAVQLLQLPHAQHMGCDIVHSLLRVALGLDNTGSNLYTAICSTSGAQQLHPGNIENFVAAAISRGMWQAVGPLCSLPAAASFPPDVIWGFLLGAVQQGSWVMAALMESPRAAFWFQGTPPGFMVELLFTVLQQAQAAPSGDDAARIELLFSVRGAQEMSSVNVHALLVAVMRLPGGGGSWTPDGRDLVIALSPAISCLCKQAVVQRLDEHTVASLMSTAVQLDSLEVLANLAQLPAVQLIGSNKTADLLLQTVQQGKMACLHLLLLLPGAHQLSMTQWALLLENCVMRGLHVLVEVCCNSTRLAGRPVPHVTNEALVNLLLLAVARHDKGPTEESSSLFNDGLLSLPEVNNIDCNQLQGLLQQAVEKLLPGLVQSLCQLPAAQQLEFGSICRLLKSIPERRYPYGCQSMARIEEESLSTIKSALAKLVARASVGGVPGYMDV